MYMKSSIIVLAAIAELVAGHGAIIKAVGDQGGEGMALGGKYLPSILPNINTNPRSQL
jgi:hypothetical protein